MAVSIYLSFAVCLSVTVSLSDLCLSDTVFLSVIVCLSGLLSVAVRLSAKKSHTGNRSGGFIVDLYLFRQKHNAGYLCVYMCGVCVCAI